MTDATIEVLDVATYQVPTDRPESDGTLEWDHTDVVVVHVRAGKAAGLGWSYAPRAAARLIEDVLKPVLLGRSLFDIRGSFLAMVQRLRNAGVPGAGMMAISAVDVALWDLKARWLGLPLVDLFGKVRSDVPIYGSGGFTSYTEHQLCEQLAGWATRGIRRVKMKVGREPARDPERVARAREAVGPAVELFVDANGAYSRKQALALAQRFSELGVSWFEEPRPSSDLAGLRALRRRAPAGMDIAAGEYGDTAGYFRHMLEADAVDCLQADLTRCGGYSGLLQVAALCEAFELPLSAHCAPQLHAHIGCALASLRHVEYFHDHVRIAGLLFDGALPAEDGRLRPDRSRPGHGMALKSADAARYRS
ncbi:MAG TPA: enolase C-terminal domain-like protein [Polyangiaceae bacterium]|nr:enolase C-terminal domain-like protein [Polyangiaceae bacterium]